MTASGLAELLVTTCSSVALAVAPLALLFLVFQVLFLRLPVDAVLRILTGTVLAAAGLGLFLAGVGIAFLPFGRLVGEAIAALPPGLVVAAGLILGFVTTWSEPAVRILADQVEEASGGSLPGRWVLWAVCIGVAVSVAVGLVRIGHDVPLTWLLVPGYALVLGSLWFGEDAFVAIAIDAGGVATGPLANSFLLALALGAASVAGGDPLLQGLGLVALIALAPVLSVMALGLILRGRSITGRVRT